MKKITFKFMAISAITMMTTACSNELDNNAIQDSSIVPMTFIATQESNGTRTTLSDNSTSILWQTGDEIAVVGGGWTTYKFTAIEGGSTSTTLDGEAEVSTKYLALYPYSAKSSINPNYNYIDFKIPSQQTAKKNNFDPAAAIMVAYTENGNNFQFLNACSYVQITTTKPYKKLSLKSEELSNTFTARFVEKKLSSIITSSANAYVDLIPEKGETLIEPGTYIFAVAPGKKTTMKVQGITENDDIEISTTVLPASGFTLERSKKYTLPLNMVAFIPTGEAEVLSSAGIPNDKVTWVQLWEDGPKFAAWNVGATKDTEVGGYYCWSSGIDRDPNKEWHKFSASDYMFDQFDTAKLVWGEKWKMPHLQDFKNLINNNCNREWNSNYKGSGLQGYVITGKNPPYNQVSLFIPAAGEWDLDKEEPNYGNNGPWGYYWTNGIMHDYAAYYIKFKDVSSGTATIDNWQSRDYQLPVRAILAE